MSEEGSVNLTDEEQKEEEEVEIDPLENPNWKFFALKSPIHQGIKFKDEFID